MDEYKLSIDTLTSKYNEAIHALEDAFEFEKGQVGRVDKLRRQYSGRYDQLILEYRKKRQAITDEYRFTHPAWPCSPPDRHRSVPPPPTASARNEPTWRTR